MLLRGGKLRNWSIKPEGDPTWTHEDWCRARTLEARWADKGVSEADRRTLIPCAVWKAKFPGLQYPDHIERALTEN
jgi:hypothetical protein